MPVSVRRLARLRQIHTQVKEWRFFRKNKNMLTFRGNNGVDDGD